MKLPVTITIILPQRNTILEHGIAIYCKSNLLQPRPGLETVYKILTGRISEPLSRKRYLGVTHSHLQDSHCESHIGDVPYGRSARQWQRLFGFVRNWFMHQEISTTVNSICIEHNGPWSCVTEKHRKYLQYTVLPTTVLSKRLHNFTKFCFYTVLFSWRRSGTVQ